MSRLDAPWDDAPWDPGEGGDVFMLDDAPFRKVRILCDHIMRINERTFYGHDPGELQLRDVRALVTERTRRKRPLYRIWSLVAPLHPECRRNPAIVPPARIFGTADFNQIPLGQRVVP